MPRKTNKKTKAKETVKELKQTHGMEEKSSYEPTTLDQIWGDTGLQKYNTLDPKEYSKWVDDQDKASLQTHASAVGLLPLDNRVELKKRLMREFHGHRAKYTKPDSELNSLPSLDKSARDTLNEGK